MVTFGSPPFSALMRCLFFGSFVLKRDLNWKPPTPAPYVAPKVGRNPRPEDRATYTPGASSSARIPRQRAPPIGDDAPAAFMRHEKKTLFKTISNMFKMCQSI